MGILGKERTVISVSLVSEKRGKRVLGRFISLSIMLLVTVTPSISREKGETTAEYYSKNEDITKGTTYYNNSPDVKIRGVDVQTGGIAGKVASLTVESVQDRTDGKSSGYNISYGIGIGEHAVMRNGTKEMADGLHTTNIGVGYSRGKHTERTTNAIGGFTAEHGVLDVIGKTVQTGSVIGGGFTLNTGTYEKNDLEDVNKRKNVGINLTFTPGVTDIYRNGRLTPDSVGGVLVGTRIDYSKDDYVAKVKATIGNNVNMTVAGKKADLSGVNRDTSKMVDVLKDKKINPVSIDLGTEYWATNYGREKTKGDFAKAGNKIERVVEIIKAVSENEGKDIGLYYRDRLDFEAERDRKERSGELETILIDRDKALEMAERAAGRKIDDLQIISTKDPDIKEIVGADAIAGRAYHVGNGKIVIVADNIGDYAKAMGTIAEEGRHIYHRNNNGLEDSEDYASFYGRQFERYYDRNFGNNDVAFITERLKYTKEQLGNDWENEASIYYHKSGSSGSSFGRFGHISIRVDDKVYTFGRYSGNKAKDGDGTLIIIDKTTYLNYYTKTRNEDVIEYQLKDDVNRDKKIKSYFDVIIKEARGENITSSGWKGHITKDKYHLLNWSCVVITEKSLNNSKNGFGNYKSPDGYAKNLNNVYNSSLFSGYFLKNGKMYYRSNKDNNPISKVIIHKKAKGK